MSFQNIEVGTINWQSVAGVSNPSVYNFGATGATGALPVREPGLYLMVSNIGGGPTGSTSVVLPAPSSGATGIASTIFCADNSCQNNLLTVSAADSSAIYGQNTIGGATGAPHVIQLYNSGAHWVGI